MRRHHGPSSSRLIVAIVFGACLVAGCGSGDDDLPTYQMDTPLRKDGTLAFVSPTGDTLTTIDIEIAETDEARARGLMGRRSLAPQSGMLFIMEETDTTGFWMRNTPLPLDIVFVAPDSQIINIAAHTTPYSEEVIRPAAPKRYVVEVRAGFAERMGLDENTRIQWSRNAVPGS